MNIKLKAFQLPLFLCPVCLCILLLLFPDNLYEEAAASTATPTGHTSFSQSYCLKDNTMISADITPLYNAHYYYIEVTEPSSVILNFTHDSQGHFDFFFYSLNESTKYTAAADKASYNWEINNLAAGRYYLTVSCTFSTCTEERYTLLYSRHTSAAASTPAAPDSDTGNSSDESSAGDDFSSSHSAAGGNTSSSDAKSTSETSIDNMEDDEIIQDSASNDKSSAIQENQTTAETKKSKNKKILIRSLQLKNKKKSLYINSSLQLKTDIRPKNATNQSLRFRSSDKSIAHVSKKGTVKALKKGTVDITVKSVDGSHLYATYTLKIKERKTAGTAAVQAAGADKNTPDASPAATEKTTAAASTAASSIRLSTTSITLHVKKTSHIKASVFPSDADDKKLCWKILNPKIASVHNGKVTAKSSGITTIIVSLKSNPSVRASCTITVK